MVVSTVALPSKPARTFTPPLARPARSSFQDFEAVTGVPRVLDARLLPLSHHRVSGCLGEKGGEP
jgi:hypothetical protein